MTKSKFIENIALIVNDENLIIKESKYDDLQKLYFKSSTQLHENDNIVKEGFLQGIKNLFSKKNVAISKTLEKFVQKYKMVPPKKDGKTQVGSWAKYQGDYIILLKGDLKALDENGKRTDFKGWPITLTVMQGDDPDSPVEGLQNIEFILGKSTTEDEIADFINKNIKKTLGISLTTDSNPPPSKQKEKSNQKNEEQKQEKEEEKIKETKDEESKAYSGEEGGNIVGFNQGKDLYQYIGGIPEQALLNPNLYYKQIIINLKNDKDMSKEQKQQVLKKAKQQNLPNILKKLQEDEKAGKMWKEVFNNFGGWDKLQFVD